MMQQRTYYTYMTRIHAVIDQRFIDDHVVVIVICPSHHHHHQHHQSPSFVLIPLPTLDRSSSHQPSTSILIAMSAPSQGLNFRIAPPPVSSPFSSAAPSPSPSSNPSSPRSDSSSSNPLPPPSLSRSSSAFKIPHAPVRPSPLAAAQRGSGFVPYVGDESDSDDEGANKRMTAHASHNHGDDEEEVGWDLDGSGRG